VNRLRHFLLGSGGIALAIGVCAGARAEKADEIRVYDGNPVKESGMTLLPWGSGEAKESEEHVFIGSRCVKILTQGRYTGGRLHFQTPLSLKSVLDDRTAYLQFVLMFPPKDGSGGSAGSGGAMPGPSGGGGRAGGGGSMAPGGGGGGAGSDKSTRLVKPKALAHLRIVLVTTDDKQVEVFLPVSDAVQRNEWSILAVPVVALNGLKTSNGVIKEMMIFGDSYANLFLGESRIIHDETPIRVDELDERTVAVGDNVSFVASADAGITPLRYEWDFDATDGVNVDAEGRSVKHKFRKPLKDDYTVTLTVRDPYGIKQPVTRKTKIHVTI